MLERIKNNPALVSAFVVALLNLLIDLNAEQLSALTTTFESVLILAGGAVTRQVVVPTRKLQN